jgi:hypothetical protein
MLTIDLGNRNKGYWTDLQSQVTKFPFQSVANTGKASLSRQKNSNDVYTQSLRCCVTHAQRRNGSALNFSVAVRRRQCRWGEISSAFCYSSVCFHFVSQLSSSANNAAHIFPPITLWLFFNPFIYQCLVLSSLTCLVTVCKSVELSQCTDQAAGWMIWLSGFDSRHSHWSHSSPNYPGYSIQTEYDMIYL